MKGLFVIENTQNSSISQIVKASFYLWYNPAVGWDRANKKI